MGNASERLQRNAVDDFAVEIFAHGDPATRGVEAGGERFGIRREDRLPVSSLAKLR